MTSAAALGSTYRLQLNGLGFTGARALVPYVHRLGIETLYLSPILAAAPGSTHGYDVIDPDRLDPALGSAEEFESLLQELAAHGMRALLDIVPNHMAAERANRWWWDTVRRGRDSAYAGTFDIDWSQHGGRVLLPVLGAPLAQTAPSASVRHEADGAVLEMGDQAFPLLSDGVPAGSITRLLAAQHFRPAYWRLGDTAGNYRRFFNIDGLVGVRVEDPDVFTRTHRLILQLCDDERIAGLRVDHIDGLWDPARYLTNLGDGLAALGRSPAVLVEKILNRDEVIDDRWPVDGTTGYEFADRAGGLFLDKFGCRQLSDIGSKLTGEPATFEELAVAGKREMLGRTFVSQLDRLARLTLAALDADHAGHDLSLSDVRRALAELTVALDVYRTYLDGAPPSRVDADTLARAAGRNRDEGDPEVDRAVALVTRALLEEARPGSPWLDVGRRWQQLTGAVMAKGVEDTATYRYNGLLSHAEVGCDSDRASCGVDEFHLFVRRRVRAQRAGLNSTSTHDSKRNEDARCRLAVLSEAGDEWGRLVRRWHRRFGAGPHGPHPRDQLVAYQSLVSLWPADRGALPPRDVRRVQEYALKAAREAKRQTSWTEPDHRYEDALRSFVSRACLDNGFCTEMGRFVRAIAPAAVSNALALTLLKVCAPGVPDFFQGTELFEATLTDPDNRRSIDFARRQALLATLPALDADGPDLVPQVEQMLADWPDGRLKMHVIRSLLHLRRDRPVLFTDGSYVPLGATGPKREHVVAWSRRQGSDWVIAVIPRLMLGHAGRGRFPVGRRVWGETTCRLPKGAARSYVDIFTGRSVTATRGRIEVASALDVLPVALLRNAG
jgi:(1->4)-alpha-D-glucan 1-alpha-D-glucosylmutase